MRKLLLVFFLLCAVALGVALFCNVQLGASAVAMVNWFRTTGSAGVILYTALYVIATVMLFPGTPLTLGAGFLYGTIVGSAVVSVASTTAATIAFLLARYVAHDWLWRHSQRYSWIRALDQSICENGFKMVLLMRLQPVFVPFAYLNMGLGLSRVRLRDFVLGSWLGMLPGTILYVYAGSLLSDAYFAHFNIRSALVHQSSRMHAISLLIGGSALLGLSVLISRIARSRFRAIQAAEGTDAGNTRLQSSEEISH